MANYVLVNNSARLIHVPTSSSVNETTALIPGAVHKLEVSKENEAFFKATVKDVPGLDVFTEKKYAEYVANKAAAEAVLNGGLDDEAEEPTEAAAPAAAPAPAGWVS